MPRLSYTTFDGTARTHDLKEGTTRVGRTPDNDLQIDELAVSAHHCELRYECGVITVKDTDSITGTYVDGQPVSEAEIRAGQVLGLGAFLVKVQESGGAGTPARPPEFHSVPLADGSYSCLRHHQSRAVHQCPQCHNLACDECVERVPGQDGTSQVRCRGCGSACQPVDWSGLTMTKKEALISLLPGPVRQAIDYWERHRKKPG